MDHHASQEFWKLYSALPPDIKARAQKQFSLLKTNPQHPSLHFKKLTERAGKEIWSARVSLDYRALAVKQGDTCTWFWIGAHSTYDQQVS
jgi:hypothetical protein